MHQPCHIKLEGPEFRVAHEMEHPRTHLRSAEYLFEHSLDGYKFVSGIVWWLSCAILWTCAVIEITITDVPDQTLDNTAVPSWCYGLLLFSGILSQFSWTFFVLITSGASMTPNRATLAAISIFLVMAFIVIAFIHFGVAERGAFAFVPAYLIPDTLFYVGCLHAWRTEQSTR